MRYDQNGKCSLCGKSAEAQTSDGRLRACRACCRDKLIPLLQDALGDHELSDLWRGSSRGQAARIAAKVVRGTPDELSLVLRAEQMKLQAKSAGRRLTPAETELSLLTTAIRTRDATLARMRRQGGTRPADMRAEAHRAVARISGKAAELSTATAKVPPGTQRPVPRRLVSDAELKAAAKAAAVANGYA